MRQRKLVRKEDQRNSIDLEQVLKAIRRGETTAIIGDFNTKLDQTSSTSLKTIDYETEMNKAKDGFNFAKKINS